ncbi:MAG: helix-turn-helix domain-containing protein [Ruminococcaceae bacterium]|nr:helix-turn-helix domain-containing protein [Oscillospiraceae bacterium]
MTFGEAMKKKREQIGLTQQELAEKLFVSRQTVCRWENGTRCPDLVMAKKIALVLGIPMDDLITGEMVEDHVPASGGPVDISCVKVMMTGIMLLLIGTFLYVADSGMMDVAGLCFVLGILVFVVGLLIPDQKKPAILDDTLPQKKCPRCGKNHDFDYPQCPHCDYDYIGRA